jgi:hypothetical protein
MKYEKTKQINGPKLIKTLASFAATTAVLIIWVGCSNDAQTPEQAAKAARIANLRDRFAAEAEQRAAARREEDDKWQAILNERQVLISNPDFTIVPGGIDLAFYLINHSNETVSKIAIGVAFLDKSRQQIGIGNGGCLCSAGPGQTVRATVRVKADIPTTLICSIKYGLDSVR